MPLKYSNKDLMDELQRLFNLLGHPPSFEDVKRLGMISPKPFQTRFGTWENVKRQLGWIPLWETFEPQSIAPEDGHWMAGIIDGEGCLTMRRPTEGHPAWDPLFSISLRDDDSFMIDELIRILGVANARTHMDYRKSESHKGMNANPAVKLTIYDIPTLYHQLIATLKIYPLRSKKKNELKVFELAVKTLLDKRISNRLNCKYTDCEVALLHQCYVALKALKQYKADYTSILNELQPALESLSTTNLNKP